MPNKTTKKQKNSRQTKLNVKPVQILVSAVLVLLILSSIASWWFISYMWQAQKSVGDIKVMTLILNAVEGFSDPAPIDAQSGKEYIPQAKLVFPMKPDTFGDSLRYSYSPADSSYSQPEEIRIVNSPAYSRAKTLALSANGTLEAFEHVPKLQACGIRGYQLSFTPIADLEKDLRFTKSLSDKRELFAYLDSSCKQPNEDFENYLKQVDSY